MILQLKRETNIEGGVYGSIAIDDGRDKYILGTLENEQFLIPAGRYPLRMTWSPRFQKLRPEICDVPEREGIRIHLGTKPQHSQGCVLVTAFGLSAIEAQINKRKKYYEDEITLEVIDPDAGTDR